MPGSRVSSVHVSGPGVRSGGFVYRAAAALIAVLIVTVSLAPQRASGHVAAVPAKSFVASPLRTWSFAYVAVSPQGSHIDPGSFANIESHRREFPSRLLYATRGLGAADVGTTTLQLTVPASVMYLTPENKWFIDQNALVEKFYDAFPDQYDYLVFGTPPGGTVDGNNGYHTNLRWNVTGIYPSSLGFPAFGYPAAARSTRVIGLTVLTPTFWTADDAGVHELHEFMHQFCCYLFRPTDVPPTRGTGWWGRSTALLDGAGHWTPWFGGGAGGVMTNNWCCWRLTDHGNGSVSSAFNWPGWSQLGPFSDIELYLAGLLPPDSVKPMSLFVPNPVLACGCLSFGGQVFAASSTQVTLTELASVNGPRVEIPVSAMQIAERAPRSLESGFHSRWLTQSDYPTMRPGESRQFWIAFRNTGTETWTRDVWGQQINLGLNGDSRVPYDLGMADGWLWQDRIATTTQNEVRPGEVGVFAFRVRAPVQRGLYSLNLRPVVDGTVWLEDEGVFWNISVQ